MPWAAESWAWVRALTGDHAGAGQILAESLARMKTAYVPSSAIAMIHLGLGEDDAVFEWLGRCVDERDAILPWIGCMSCFARLRPDPRFQAVLSAIGLAGEIVQG